VRQLDAGVDLSGTREPIRILMTCIQVFAAAGDPRETELVEKAYQFLQGRAEKILDEDQRRRFIESVPWHLDLLASYQALQNKVKSN
jgi:hypothetical protein